MLKLEGEGGRGKKKELDLPRRILSAFRARILVRSSGPERKEGRGGGVESP